MVNNKASALSLAVSALSLAGSADAFWRLPCRGRSGVGRLDPIMDPGKVSDHVHVIHGGSSTFFDIDIMPWPLLTIIQTLALTTPLRTLSTLTAPHVPLLRTSLPTGLLLFTSSTPTALPRWSSRLAACLPTTFSTMTPPTPAARSPPSLRASR